VQSSSHLKQKFYELNPKGLLSPSPRKRRKNKTEGIASRTILRRKLNRQEIKLTKIGKEMGHCRNRDQIGKRDWLLSKPAGSGEKTFACQPPTA
jgi:hypothetical protein